jgi:large subunit ribosomal protein L17
MRHLKRTAKLGRTPEHRNAMLANLVCSLIKHKRVTTTLAKAKAARSVAEKLVTLGKEGTIHSRRLAVARLHQEDAAKILFKEIAPVFKERNGGYTRIIRMEQRIGDSAQRAILEWVDFVSAATEAAETAPAGETKPEEGKPAETKPSESKAEAKTAEGKTEESKPAEPKKEKTKKKE